VRDTTDSNIYVIKLGAKDSLRALTSGIGNRIGAGSGGVRWLNDHEVLYSGRLADGVSTVLVVDEKGGAPRRLIYNMPVWNVTPSPDGTRIGFLSNKSGSSQIWTADATGAGPRQMTSGGSVSWLSFMPGGRSLVYLRQDNQQLVWRRDLDGTSEPVQVTKLPTNQPAVSPDGKSLLCRMRSTTKGTALWRTTIVPLEGNAPPRYYDVPRYGGSPMLVWMPDGRAFAYVDWADGIANVWTQDVAGGEPRQVTFFEPGEIYAFDVARDGKRVALSRGQSTRDAVLIRDWR
jgi:Tol biopolymer transport system component